MSVSSAPPSSSISAATAAAGTATGPAQAVVVQVLAAYGGDAVRNGLVQTLQNTAGSGGILSGTIIDVRADGTFTLQTKTGTDLVLHHPPELPLTVGSAVTLRLVSISPAPQVSILTVDGKLVSSQLTGTVNPPPGNPPLSPTTPVAAAAASPSGTPLPPLPGTAPVAVTPLPLPVGSLGLPPATLASTVLATISLADEVAIESALSGEVAIAAPTDDPAAAPADAVIATLVRAAPARVGSAPVPPGTRYLATVVVSNAETQTTAPPRVAAVALPTAEAPADPASETPALTASSPTTDDPAAETPPSAVQTPTPTQQASAPPVDLSDFKTLSTVLAGRVLTNSTASETLVETAVGTLSIPVQDSPPPAGAAIQLKITAVAPPETAAPAVASKEPTEATPATKPLLQDATQILTQVAPALAQQIQTQLSLPPNDELTSLILNFLGGLKAGPTPLRWPDAPSRKALVEAGRSDVAAKLDTEASQIGQNRPAPPGDWSITVLPYLGLATTKPMRLYRRAPDPEERARGGGDRFVIELQMVRLGPLQFDGLVRERRFDLVLRSETPIEDGLKHLVERTFRDSLLIAGWAGELSYARTGPVPMIPLQPDGAGVGLSA